LLISSSAQKAQQVAGEPVAILIDVRVAKSRKRDGPPATVAYFEKPIMQAIAGPRTCCRVPSALRRPR